MERNEDGSVSVTVNEFMKELRFKTGLMEEEIISNCESELEEGKEFAVYHIGNRTVKIKLASLSKAKKAIKEFDEIEA